MKKSSKTISVFMLCVYFIVQNSASQATKISDLEENLRGQTTPRIPVEDSSDKAPDSMSSHVLRRCLFKCIHFIVQNFVSYTTRKRAYTQVENSFDKVPGEIFSYIFRNLSARDLARFGAISKQLYQQKVAYQENLANALIASTQYDYEDDWSSLVARQSQKVDYLKEFKDALNQPFEQQMIRKINTNITQKNQCAFVLKGSPLNLYLNQSLLAGDKPYQHSTGFILYQHNKAYFDQELFPTESDETYQAIMAQHLFSQMALYVPKINRDTALASFFNRNKLVIRQYLKDIYTANNYVRFSSSLTADQLINNHHILITDDEISDPENKKVLSTLLNHNKDHKVVLEVGRKFIKDGCLNMKASDLPKGLAHLILTNTTGNATAIGDNFLHSVINLKSCDTAGLINVISIGDNFLTYDIKLQSVDTAGFVSVTFIKSGFLCNTWELKFFDSTGLTSLISIGDTFLARTFNLKFFDINGFVNVTSIDNRFLWDAWKLQSFNTAGLMSVISIGNHFLSHARELQSFDIARLINIKSIGDRFLDRTPWLKMNKTSLDAWKKQMML